MSHIDTLTAYKKLVATGIPENQAEVQVKLLNESFDGVCTKDDLRHLKNTLILSNISLIGGCFLIYLILPFVKVKIGW